MTASNFQLAGNAAEAYERHVRPIMAPFVERLIEGAALRPGGSLLDVACGPGFAARAAAPLVGERGRVAGLDINPPMLEAARAFSAGVVPPIEWVEASALEMPFADGEFEAVVCQQGFQFFPDHQAAAREFARVAAPGARVAVSFWMPLDHQPFMGPQHEKLQELLGAPAVEMFSRAFGLDPDLVRRVFAEAGLREIAVEEIHATVTLPHPAGFVPVQVGALPFAQDYAALPPEQQADYVDHMCRALEAYVQSDGDARVPFASYLVTARR